MGGCIPGQAVTVLPVPDPRGRSEPQLVTAVINWRQAWSWAGAGRLNSKSLVWTKTWVGGGCVPCQSSPFPACPGACPTAVGTQGALSWCVLRLALPNTLTVSFLELLPSLRFQEITLISGFVTWTCLHTHSVICLCRQRDGGTDPPNSACSLGTHSLSVSWAAAREITQPNYFLGLNRLYVVSLGRGILLGPFHTRACHLKLCSDSSGAVNVRVFWTEPTEDEIRAWLYWQKWVFSVKTCFSLLSANATLPSYDTVTFCPQAGAVGRHLPTDEVWPGHLYSTDLEGTWTLFGPAGQGCLYRLMVTATLWEALQSLGATFFTSVRCCCHPASCSVGGSSVQSPPHP